MIIDVSRSGPSVGHGSTPWRRGHPVGSASTRLLKPRRRCSDVVATPPLRWSAIGCAGVRGYCGVRVGFRRRRSCAPHRRFLSAPRRIGWVWPCPSLGFGVSARAGLFGGGGPRTPGRSRVECPIGVALVRAGAAVHGRTAAQLADQPRGWGQEASGRLSGGFGGATGRRGSAGPEVVDFDGPAGVRMLRGVGANPLRTTGGCE